MGFLVFLVPEEMREIYRELNENEISFNIITTCSNIEVIRIKEVITEDKTSWYLDKFSLLVP